MRTLTYVGAAIFAVAGIAAVAQAADVKSGILVGGSVGTYSTTKVCGASDGVRDGQSLCYT